MHSLKTHRFSLFCFVGPGLFAYLLADPHLLIEIDWDAAIHLFRASTEPGQKLMRRAYTAHPALWPVVVAYARFGELFGIEIFQIARLFNALCFGTTALVVSKILRGLDYSPTTTFMAISAWCAASGNTFLLRRLEDNVLYLPFQALFIYLCCVKFENWSKRLALLSGVLMGAAFLVHWTTLAWLPVLLLLNVALFNPAQPLWSRTRGMMLGLFLTGVLIPVAGYGLFLVGLGGKFSAFVTMLTSSPNPLLFKPLDLEKTLSYLGCWPQTFLSFWPWTYDARLGLSTLVEPPPSLGVTLLILVLGLTYSPLLRSPLRSTVYARRLFIVGLCFLTTTLVPAIKYDFTAVFERYDVVPIVVITMLAALGKGRLLPTSNRHWRLALCATIVALYVGATLYHDFSRFKPQSVYAYYLDLREKNKEACGFRFVVAEVHNVRLVTALSLAIPNHRVIGRYPGQMRYQPKMISVKEAAREDRACLWYSDPAQRLLNGIFP